MSLKDGRNKIIIEATFYGGDAGGPYCCNPEDLVEYLIEYIIFRGWLDFCTIKEEDGYIIIAERK